MDVSRVVNVTSSNDTPAVIPQLSEIVILSYIIKKPSKKSLRRNRKISIPHPNC